MVQEAAQAGWNLQAIVLRADQALAFAERLPADVPAYQVSPETFSQLSHLQSPEGILAIVDLPWEDFAQPQPLDTLPPGPGFLLDAIQDPGNLGTIIRTADWFGLRAVICGPGTVDLLNPKTLRSSMGSVFRVDVRYVASIEPLLPAATVPIWAATMEGEPLQAGRLSGSPYVLLGNEANGLDERLLSSPNVKPLTIPGQGGAESLNVSIAAGILAWHLAQS